MNIIVNSLAVHYTRAGKGRAILLLHGWGDTLASFDAIAHDLVKRYEVVRVDLPGFGGTQAPDAPWGLIEYAEFIQAFAAKLDMELYAIAGHSNGGAIAIKAVALGLVAPAKLVLLASAGVRNRAPIKKQVWGAVAKAGKVITIPLPDGTRSKLRRRLYGAASSDLLVAPHLEATFKRITSEDVQHDAERLELPTLIIYGAHDKATPPEFAELFHQAIAGSKLVMLERVGHFVHQENTPLVISELEDFLA